VGPRRQTSDPCHSILTALAMKDVEPSWLLGYLYPDFIVGGGKKYGYFQGSGVAIITPMNEDGSVNYEKLDEILEEQIANETDAIIICGTTGESATLSVEEHLDVIRHTIENGQSPDSGYRGDRFERHRLRDRDVEGGGKIRCGRASRRDTVLQQGDAARADRHYTTIAEKVSLPIIMYNVPSRTGVNIAPETAAYLGKNVKNIVAVKAASGSLSQIAKTKHLAGDALDIYSAMTMRPSRFSRSAESASSPCWRTSRRSTRTTWS
jgi:4-hydroxy-tetrahydrodipicolinate synthase